MQVGDLVKYRGITGLGIIVDTDRHGHFFICWHNGIFLHAPFGLELISASR